MSDSTSGSESERLAQGGCTIWFTGMSGAGKSTCSAVVAQLLQERGVSVEVLDGDEVRRAMTADLGFSKEDRDENVRRIGYVAKLLTRNGIFVCVAAISPYREARKQVRESIGRFVLVYCRAPLEVLEERDVKGLYRRARAGEIPNFTGISDPYEEPEEPEEKVSSDGSETVEMSAERVVRTLEDLGYLKRSRSSIVTTTTTTSAFEELR